MSIDPQSLGPAARAQILRKIQEEDRKKASNWISEMEAAMGPKRKPAASKMKNVRTTVNGITFDSKKEAERYLVLLDELKAGIIQDLRLQYEIMISPGWTAPDGSRIRSEKYLADFVYFRKDPESGKWIQHFEDVKGFRTQVYKNKKKALANMGIFIEEV